MAYTPSLADLPPAAAQAYTPSLADLPPVAAPSFLSQVGSAVNSVAAPIAAGANEQTGGAVSGLGSLVSGATNLAAKAPSLFGLPSLPVPSYNPGQALQNIGNAVTANAPSNYNGQQPTLGQQTLQGAAHYAPDVIAAADTGVGLAGNIKDWISGAAHDTAAKGLYDQLSGGVGKDNLNAVNNATVIQNVQNQLDNSEEAYTPFFNTDVPAKGYATSGSPGIPGLDIATPGKFIKPQATTNTIIDKGAINDPNNPASSLYKNVSGDTQGLIQQYNSSPTVNNAHLLQSQLGKEAANIRSGLNTNIPDATQAKTITAAQKALQNDIHSTFNANGDKDLSAQYTQLGQDYKNNVVPSMNVPQIWRAYNKPESAPANIASVLSKPSPNRATILQQLSKNNPQSINSLAAQVIPKVGQFDQYGNSTTNAENVLKGYANLPSTLKNAMPAQSLGALQQLQNSAKLRNTLVKGTAAATGAGATIGGLYALGKHLED